MTAPITRSQIPSQNISGTTGALMVSGFSSVGDSGAGAIYSSNGATSGGIMAIQDSLGVWFNLIGPTTGPVNAGIFGFVAGATASNPPQVGMRAHAIANPGTKYVFSPGQYNLTAPNFLYGVKDIEISAYGASFYNINAGVFPYGDVANAFYIGSGSIYHTMNSGGLDPLTANNGDLITDTVAGASTVTCVTHANAANYAAGNWVFINWYVRQTGSFPPNPGFFEYARVATAGNGSTGVITLDRQLKNAYKATSFEDSYLPATYGVTYGKARILNLNRSDYQVCEKFILRGGNGLLNGAGPAGPLGFNGGITMTGVIDAELYDVNFHNLLPTMSRSVKVYGGTFADPNYTSEIDKELELLYLEDTVISNFIQGTGVSEFKMLRGRLSGNDYGQSRARKFSLDGTVVACGSGSGAQLRLDGYAKDMVSIKDCRLLPPAGQGTLLGMGGAVQCTPDAVTATTMTFNAGNAQMDPGLRSATDIGTKISLQSGTTPQIFTVTDIAFDGSSNMILTGTYTVTPTAGDIATPLARNVQTIKLLSDLGGHVMINPPSRYRIVDENPCFVPCQNGQTTGPRTLTFPYKNGVAGAPVIQGFVTSVTVNVIKAYTGSDATATLDVANLDLGAVVNYGTVNCKIAGVRVCSTAGATGAQSGDTWATTIPNGAWCESMYQLLGGTGGSYTFADAAVDKLPLITVTVQTL